MNYEIDQSGKIEDTARDTIVAYSNGRQYAARIPREVKRQVQEIFRQHGYTKFYIYFLFSYALYILMKNFKQPANFIIDIEYPGKNQLIGSLIKDFLKKNAKPAHHIYFARIGNHPKVHYAAYDVFKGKKRADYVVKLDEVLKETKNSRWALKRVSFNSGRRSGPTSDYTVSRKHKKLKQK